MHLILFTHGGVEGIDSPKKQQLGGYMSKGVKVCATYSVVTPMFLSGADQSKPELRVSSIRGALRFWWRALAWNRCKGDLKKIREEEFQLFGSTSTGQGMLMRLVGKTNTSQWKTGSKEEQCSVVPHDEKKKGGFTYFAYGVANFRKELKHGVFQKPSDFTIQCLLTEKQVAHKDSLCKALIALGTFGGLGAKSRKGFGSLNIKSLLVDDVSYEGFSDDALERIKTLMGGETCAELPPYSAFSRCSLDGCPCQVVDLGIEESSPEDALGMAGFEMAHYRGWGFRLKSGRRVVCGKEAQQNFPRDHEWYCEYKENPRQRPRCIAHPQRAVFGLPHSYDKGKKVGRSTVKPVDSERRGAPILFHVFPSSEGYRVLAIVLTSTFLPPEKTLEISYKRGDKQVSSFKYIPVTAAWNILQDFIKTFEGGEVLYSAPEDSHNE
ncbi:hypothetical protein JCM16814_04620 [Desulfobaculum senezii]